MSNFYNARGEIQELAPVVSMYRQAADAGQNLQQFLAANYVTDTKKFGSTFDQLCASEGIVSMPNKELGVRASTMYDIFEGRPSIEGAVTTKDAIPASRILFPAFFMQAVEDRLIANQTMTADAFEKMIAIDDSVAGDRYEQPQINYTNPTAGKSQRISQSVAPASMMTITTSDRPYRIPSFSLGLEISDQAVKAASIDLVSLSVSRQIMIERNTRAQGYLTSALNGDPDNTAGGFSEPQLSSLTGTTTPANLAGSQKYRNASDANMDPLSTGGVLTQKAWMKYLTYNSQLRTITHVVTDLDGALAIQNRTGRPSIFGTGTGLNGDSGVSPRINTNESVMNPLWADSTNIFITVDPNWPAKTIMGIDSRFALRRVTNLNAEYTAIEAFVMRRSTQMRFDWGQHVTRLFIDAFDCLYLA